MSLLRIITIIVVIWFLVVGCATINEMTRPTPPDFDEYIELYTKLTGRNVLYSIHFNYAENSTVGKCAYLGTRPLFITINSYYWVHMKKNERMALIFHELGHCNHGFNHDDTLLADGCPTTLMGTYKISESCLIKHGIYNYIRIFLEKIVKAEVVNE